MNSVASATVRSPQLLVLTPFDPQVKDNIAKAIQVSGLGFTPQVEGEEILIVVPPMNQDTKSSIIKAVKKAGENAKVRIRRVRREVSWHQCILKWKQILGSVDNSLTNRACAVAGPCQRGGKDETTR